MRKAGIIPARYQSTRFPGKPLVDILGKPMIQHVYERSARVSCLDRVLVATDDRRIFDAVRSFGGEAIMTREDHSSGTDRLAEAGLLLGLGDDDIVVNIQGDEPLVEPAMIECLVQSLGDAPMATLAFQSHDEEEYASPNVVKVVVDRSMKALYFSRSPIPCRRDADGSPLSFLKHLGFYAYRHAFLQRFTRLPAGALETQEKLEQLRTLEHGYPIHVALSPVETHGIDTPRDLERILRKG